MFVVMERNPQSKMGGAGDNPKRPNQSWTQVSDRHCGNYTLEGLTGRVVKRQNGEMGQEMMK